MGIFKSSGRYPHIDPRLRTLCQKDVGRRWEEHVTEGLLWQDTYQVH